MSGKSELERIALLAARFGPASQAGGGAVVETGIGDDAAVLTLPDGGALVWTIDAQIEGTHFRADWASWEDVGWRSFMAAASDLAAMAASPIAALSALSLADGIDDAALDALARGQAEAARIVGAPVVGGNLARGKETSVTTTLLGRAERPALRSGARAGEGIWLAGAVGSAAAGLLALERGLGDDARFAEHVTAWRRPRALIELGVAMAGKVSAAVDVSDGLAGDARRIAEASGVSFVLDEASLRARGMSLAAAAAHLGRDALDLMLAGGEDYALVVTSTTSIDGFDRIGSVETGPAGVVLARADGSRAPIDARGYDHFR